MTVLSKRHIFTTKHINMKKFFTYFFTTLGVIFFVLLCVLAYLWFADPFNVRPLIEMMTADSPSAAQTVPASDNETTGETSTTPTTQDKHPALSAEQESALETIGINPANVPSSITPEMEACFITKLGTTRVAEIKAGATPSASEVFTTRSCYQ